MLNFRGAAAENNLLELERLWFQKSDNFNIDEPSPITGKTAAHFAAKRGHFKTIYWLLEKGANFFCKDNQEKTAIDYIQEHEFTFINSDPILKGDRKYYLCNTHYKIWFAHDPDCFMPYLYQEDFRQYREKNPNGYLSLVYSEDLLSATALKNLKEFAEKYRIELISFEKELAKLTEQFGTEEDRKCYELASYELSKYPNEGGGNLAVVSDLIRWSSVLLRKGSYADTDVEIGQHKWTGSISMEKSFALNLGSLIYPDSAAPVPWINGDIIVISSLFSQPHLQGDFRITLSKAAFFMIKKVQLSLLLNCQQNMNKRISSQLYYKVNSGISSYMQNFFRSSFNASFTKNFSPEEISKIQESGLESYDKEKKSSIIKKMSAIMRKRVEDGYDTPQMAHKHNDVFKDVKDDEHEKFLINFIQSQQMSCIKNIVKELSGTPIFAKYIWTSIEEDDWKKYSIYSDKALQSAFRSTNTVKFDTDIKDNERRSKTEKIADLSFTSFGMADVLQRSEALQREHQKQEGASSKNI